ncbi:MAG: ATP-grasp domain-containing protein, partial [Acidimicrobiia bacterium]
QAGYRPLVVKPYLGHRGEGITVVWSPEELAGLPEAVTPMLVQEYVAGPGEDLKVYVIGDEVSAVRKPFSADSFTRPGRPFPVGDEVREIAARAGRALGMGLFGLDIIEGPAGPVVVDVNYFPGYKGVPGAAPRVAAYIEAYVLGQLELTAALAR